MQAPRIVVFLCVLPGTAGPLPGDPDGPEQLDLLFRSALKVNPSTRFTVLTTPDTDLSAVSVSFERINDGVDPDRLMFERTRMQKDFIARGGLTGPIAFLDSDMLLFRDFAPLFEENFDIGLTWREDAEMPFNGGVILANNRRPEAVLRFFEHLERIYLETQEARLAWYGDQYALTEVVGKGTDWRSRSIEDRDGIRYRFLPCETHNHPPSNHGWALMQGPGDAHLLHFKGFRRRYMVPFWTYWGAMSASSRVLNAGRVLADAVKLSLGKQSYRREFDRRRRRFNLHRQTQPTWSQRARTAAELALFARNAIGSQPAIADIGCGDRKLEALLAEIGFKGEYQGYDLIPQDPKVRKFDITCDPLPGRADIAFLLGVLEYVADPRTALDRIRACAPWLVVSHAASDLHRMKDKEVRGLQWRMRLSTGEFERVLSDSGYSVVQRQITPDKRTAVWLCRDNAQSEGASA